MKSAAVDQWNNAQMALSISNLVGDDGGVLTLDHEHSLLDTAVADLIAESREWVLAKLLEVFESLRMDRARVLVIGQRLSVYLLVQR
jgi:hypothetical protein